MKCSICNKKLEETFLGKIKGTYIKKHGKKYTICNDCQTKFNTKEEIIAIIKPW